MDAHRSPSGSRACAVCGSVDARTLSSTTLASGVVLTVCGSHAVAHARAPRQARTVADLRALLADRRESQDRRGRHAGEVDELAQSLAAAFRADRRGPGRRLADA